MPLNRPAVSRDTRLLLTIALIAVATLWVLARIRFPDRPPTPNPVPPVLAQLTPPSALEDVVSTVAQLETHLEPLIVPVDVQAHSGQGGETTPVTLPALRFRTDLALVLMPPNAAHEAIMSGSQALAYVGWDAASRLAVVRIGDEPSELATSAPRRLPSPRFVIAASAYEGLVSLRPVFVTSLVERKSPIWSGTIWSLPAAVDLAPGMLVFDVEGAWMGLTADDGGRRAIVPAERVLAAANRLMADGQQPRGWLGVEVQRLTPALIAATGTAAGVIVTWVDPQGPAAGQLAPGDGIDAIDGEPVSSVDDWTARISRLPENAPVVLRARQGSALREVRVTAHAVPSPRPDRPLGLGLRTVSGIGATIVQVDAGSAAAHAGLQVGDVLTLIGDLARPTAAQASRAFTAAPRDRPILIGLTRGDNHRVVAIERTW